MKLVITNQLINGSAMEMKCNGNLTNGNDIGREMEIIPAMVIIIK